jgi:hypothetical protein
LSEKVSLIWSQCSFQVQSAYFKVWTQFMRTPETLTKIILYVFTQVDTLTDYLEGSVKVVTRIQNEVDRSRSEIVEYLLSMIRSAVDLDYMFLFSKGEQTFRKFFTLIDNIFTKSFGMQTKLEAILIFKSFFIQHYKFSDTEFLQNQGHERQKLLYAPMEPVKLNDEVKSYLDSCLE